MLHAESKQLKLNQLNFFAIPLMAITGLATLGIFAINQDINPSASATTTPVSSTVSYDDEYITISSSSAINLNHDKVATDSTSVYTTDNVTVSTNVATGYELYLTSTNKDSAALTSTTTNDSIAATSGTGGELGTPKVLDDNSYGYAVPSSLINNTGFDTSYASPTSTSKWAGIPAGTSDRIRSTNAANESGDTVDVHYAANLNNAITPGTYTGSVTYSAVVTPTSGNYTMSVSPSLGTSTGGTTLTINSGPTTINIAANLDTSEVEVCFRQSGTTKGKCTVTNVSVTSGHLVTTCTAPALSAGSYDVMISVPRYGFKDTKSDGYIILASGTLKTVLDSLNITTMQGLGSLSDVICSASTTTTWASGQTDPTLTDTRDNSTYTIRKLADGHCWMVQNLRLMNKTISSSDSDISSGSFTIPANISGSGTGKWCNSDSADCYNRSLAYYNNNTTYGAYYNWYTATAGTGTYSMASGDATSSICPKGWKLPTNSGYYSWYYLYTNKYSSDRSTFQAATLTGSSYWAGYVDNGSLSGVGSLGYWWSRTACDAYNAYHLLTYGSYVTPQSGYNKHVGYSVRCVLTSE